MDAERWRKIEQLYHAALEREARDRPAFLEQACAGDEELRRKVEALLARDQQAENFLQTPALEVAAKALAEEQTRPHPSSATAADLVGKTLSHYRVLEKLGQGGMGVVYKARDTHLDRPVAIKVLRPEVVADQERKRRFVQEAKTASALNHPNILHVYDIDESDGMDFIAMEYVPGKTLEQLIGRKGLKLNDTLKYGAQIADAMVAAHAAGIIHRDLKPGNVMVTDRGLVKVLDFGLAKLAEPASGEPASTTLEPQTEEGAIVGTVAYMSPEQAQGKKVDTRSDIFSFGSVLYEMVTGRRAFHGGSNLETLAMVMREEPKPMPASVPPDLAKIVVLCLKKDPDRRFQHMADLKVTLQEAMEQVQPGSPSGSSVLPEIAKPARWGLLMAAAAVLLSIVAASLWLGRSRQPVEMGPLIRLTSDPGLNTTPALSPDGKLLAYASDRAGSDNLDIWVKQVDGGVPLRLTSDPADESEPSFSPDGSQIVFRSGRDGGGIYTIPALGGEPRLIAKGGRNPSFSPDGSRIALVLATGPTPDNLEVKAEYGAQVAVVVSTGGTPQRLTSGTMGAAFPVWSPDGKFILFSTGVYRSDDWAVVSSGPGPPDSASVINLDALKSEGLADVNPHQWMADNRILFSAESGDSSHMFEVKISPPGVKSKEWRLNLPPKRLTFGTNLDEAASLASGTPGTSSRRLAFASLVRSQNIWSLNLDTNRPRPTDKAQQLTRENGIAAYPYISRDGTKLVFLLHSAYNDELWSLDLKTGKRLLLSTMVSFKRKAVIRSDSSRVLLEDDRPGGLAEVGSERVGGLYAVSFSGGDLEKLCDHCGYPWDWSAEHKRILFWDRGETSVRAAMLNTETGKRSVFMERPGTDLYDFQWSPDGRWIALAAQSGPWKRRLYVAPFTGDKGPSESAWIPITDGSTFENFPNWSPDGNWIYTFSDRDGFECVWAYPLEPETKRPAGAPVGVFHSHGLRLSTRNNTETTRQLTVARDRIVFNQGEITGNIWMTTLPVD